MSSSVKLIEDEMRSFRHYFMCNILKEDGFEYYSATEKWEYEFDDKSTIEVYLDKYLIGFCIEIYGVKSECIHYPKEKDAKLYRDLISSTAIRMLKEIKTKRNI